MINQPIGENEVRITKVWTVEAANEFGSEHDPTPNWKERGVPAIGGTGLITDPPALHLRIHAEAGKAIGAILPAVPYTLTLSAVCLTNPAASNTVPIVPLQAPETFAVWEYQAHEERYTRDWSIAIAGAGATLSVPPAPNHQTDEVWQYYVVLRHDAPGLPPGTPLVFACTGVSEPFYLPRPF
jgi:hypothetical protein